MILTGPEIQRRMGGDIRIDPFHPSRLNANGYNLRLHDELIFYEEVVLDLRVENRNKRTTIPSGGYVLQPGKVYLGRTIEYTRTENLLPSVAGRSSLGSLGMMINASAQHGDCGFHGCWTLQISVIQPLRVYAGIEVCRISYRTLCGELGDYSGGKYQDNTDIQPSRMHCEFEDDSQMKLNFNDADD